MYNSYWQHHPNQSRFMKYNSLSNKLQPKSMGYSIIIYGDYTHSKTCSVFKFITNHLNINNNNGIMSENSISTIISTLTDSEIHLNYRTNGINGYFDWIFIGILISFSIGIWQYLNYITDVFSIHTTSLCGKKYKPIILIINMCLTLNFGLKCTSDKDINYQSK